VRERVHRERARERERVKKGSIDEGFVLEERERERERERARDEVEDWVEKTSFVLAFCHRFGTHSSLYRQSCLILFFFP